MRVLVVSEPGDGGVFAFVEALCGYLLRRGATVHLAYSDDRSCDRLYALVERVEASGGQTVNMRVGNSAGLRDIAGFARLWRLALQARPDVVHCHSSKAGALGRALRLVGIRAAYVYHPHAYYGMKPGPDRLAWLYDGVESLMGRVGTTIVVSSDERRFALQSLGIPPERVVMIPNGIDTARFAPAGRGAREDLRREFGLPAGRIILGSLGRLSPQKDPLTLYRAFAMASSKRPDIHLLHVGTGELEGDVEGLVDALGIRDWVTRIPYLRDTAGFYQAADGFILTSLYEGLSIASLEAMSSDLPLILSRAPGNTDLLDLGLSHVWAAATGDIAGFAACIGLWHDSRARGAAPNHRIVAIERFSADDSLSLVRSHYESRVRAASGGRGPWRYRLPVAACLAAVAFESTERFGRARTQQFLFPFFHWLAGISYGDFYDWNYLIRKAGHVLGYGLLCALWYRMFCFELRDRNSGSRRAAAAFALAAVTVVASLDEWHQTFVPGRTGRFSDVLLDSASGIAALGLMLLVAGVSRRSATPRASERPSAVRTVP